MSTLEKAIGVNSIMGIAHEYATPTLAEKETGAFENAVIEKHTQKSTLEERQRGFQGLMSFAGTLPEDFDYKKELEEAREEMPNSSNNSLACDTCTSLPPSFIT